MNPPHPFAAQLKSIHLRENGQSPAPRRQKTAFSIFQMGGGQACRDQTKPKRNQNQNHTPEKATAEKEMPIFGLIGPTGFTFAPKNSGQKTKRNPTWLAKQQEQKQNSTPGKASSVVQNMQHENILPPSLQKLLDDLLQDITPQCKSSVATSQYLWSQKPKKN